ncbi:MAG: hypothetical protein ACQEW8_07545 [Actinomycetota bacterium]
MTMRDDADADADAETAELRSLQARAYGRDGGLTAAEVARLAELEDRRRGAAARVDESPVPPLAPAGPVVHTVDVSTPANQVNEQPAADGADPAASEAHDTGTDTTGRTRASGWLVRGAATLAILAVGIGIGWVLFGRGADSGLPLTAEQQDRRAELAAEGEYDPGSLRAVEDKDDLLVWLATEDQGEKLCVILDAQAESRSSCEPAERAREAGLSGDLTVIADGDDSRVWWVSVLFARDDTPAVLVNSSDGNWAELEFQTEEEQRIADEIVDLGYDAGSVSIVGYRGDDPLWTATNERDVCLIALVDGVEPATDCVAWDTFYNEGSLTIIVPELADRVLTGMNEITYRVTPEGSPYIEITDFPVEGLSDDAG